MMLHYLRREFKAASGEPAAAAFLLLAMLGALALAGAVLHSLTVVDFVLFAFLWPPIAVVAATAAQLSLARHHGLDKLLLANPVSAGKLLAARALLVLGWSLLVLLLMLPAVFAVGAILGAPAWDVLLRGAAAYLVLTLAGVVVGSFLAVPCARLSAPLALGAGATAGFLLLTLGTNGYQTMNGRRVVPAELMFRGPSPWSVAYELFHGDLGAALILAVPLLAALAALAAGAWALLRFTRDASGWTRPIAAALIMGVAFLGSFLVPALAPVPPVVQHAEFESSNVGGFVFQIAIHEDLILEGPGPHELVIPVRALPLDALDQTPGPVKVSLREATFHRPLGRGALHVSPPVQDTVIVPDPEQTNQWKLDPTTWTIETRGAFSGKASPTFLLLEVTRGEEKAYDREAVTFNGLTPSLGPLVGAAVAYAVLSGLLLWRVTRRGRRAEPDAVPTGG